MAQHAHALPAGLWVVRLRAPFDRTQFVSPASEALRDCAHAEITGLFDRAAHAPLPARPSRPPRASGRR
jgi:ribonuclease P protein component